MRYFILSFLFSLVFITASAQETSISVEKILKPKFHHRCLKPKSSFNLSTKIKEGSGLVAWNGQLWTHNDSDIPKLFALDTTDGHIAAEYALAGCKNTDWEELSQDSVYFYLGDIGNNAHRRDTLNIVRINKKSLLARQPLIDTIAFSWPETMTNEVVSHENFDCEAMAVIGDSIFLFTKEWQKGHRSRVFSIPKIPGKFTAHYKFTLKTRVLVTGASFDIASSQLVLCGYNLLARPFLLVFADVMGTDFFKGRGNKVKIRKRFRQTEGVATFDGRVYYVINEDFHFWFLHTEQALHKIDLRVD